MNVVTIVGTRPEIIRLCDWEKEVIFTGQHYDPDMGKQFFEEQEGKNLYGVQPYNPLDLNEMVKVIKEKIKEFITPNIIIVHGDTRSALAGAIAAHELKICLAHTEAGVRSFDDSSIEEKYRIQIDHIANYNFCPIPQAVYLLKKEAIAEGVYFVGDILYDKFLKERGSWDFVFVTIHRRQNICNKERLKKLIDSLADYSQVIFCIHPHTRKKLEEFKIELPRNTVDREPMSHFETLQFIKDARLVLTDSGGIEREAFWLGTPCKVARKNTEWMCCTGAFGDGKAGEKIYKILTEKQPYRKVENGFPQ